MKSSESARERHFLRLALAFLSLAWNSRTASEECIVFPIDKDMLCSANQQCCEHPYKPGERNNMNASNLNKER